MPSLNRRLELLRSLDRESAAAILAAAIPHSAPDELEALGRAAIAMSHPACLAAVVRDLHRFPPSVAEACAVRPGPWSDALRAVLSGREGEATANAVRLVSRRREAALAPMLVPLLDRTAAPLPALAAEALLEVAVSVAGSCGRGRSPDAVAAAVDAAVAAGVRAFRVHRQDDVLLAAALLTARPGPALAELLEEDDDLHGPALRGIVERIDHPIVCGNLIRWLGHPQLQRAAARWISRVAGEASVTQLLRDGHLLLSPRRRAFVRRIDRPLRCVPGLDVAIRLPAAAQAVLPLLVCRLDLSLRTRVAHLAEMSALPAARARLRAVGALLAQGDERGTAALEPFSLDSDSGVARLASHRFLAPGAPANDSHLKKLIDAGHASIALRATRRLARSSVLGFFEHWGSIGDSDRRAAALGLLRREGGAFVSGLARSISSGPAATQLRAVMLARRLGLEPQVEEELLRLATDAVTAGRSPATRLATAAVAALGRGRSGGRVEVLLSALAHPDDRIAANAVEALAGAVRGDGRCPDDPGPIVEVMASMARSPRHRARGNAVRGLLRSRAESAATGAAEHLRAMLTDMRPLHRVSGIWVAKRSGSPAVVDELRSLADSDRLPEVRVRAMTALRLLGSPGPNADGYTVAEAAAARGVR